MKTEIIEQILTDGSKAFCVQISDGECSIRLDCYGETEAEVLMTEMDACVCGFSTRN